MVCVLLTALAGCESLVDHAVSAACGESQQEREDRQRLDSYRQGWATPGRTEAEIETEARGTFRRTQGRDPNLNWHAR